MSLDKASLGWPLSLPGEDRKLSPSTGFTREHWATTADNLLLSVRPFRSPRGAQIDLPGSPARAGARSDGLEGFARTFLLAAIRVAGDQGRDDHHFLDEYLNGVVAGTCGAASGAAPTPGETWQPIRDVGPGGQPMVESASIALGLHLTKPWTWDRLSETERDDLEAWLRQAFRHEPAPNNWYLFPLTVASFLEAAGRGDAETASAINRGLYLLETWYRGDGWYSDGGGRAFDHYIGWAMHFYPVLFAHLRVEDAAGPSSANNELLGMLGSRLHEFLSSFVLTFDRNGAPLYQGRSLTYRTATLASVALGEVVGHTPLRPGQTRRLLSQTLRYFLENGSVADGLFSRGWHGAHAASLQPYSGPASPYWASKGFLGLLLPAEHPMWTATEELLDSDNTDATCAVGPVGWLIQRTGADGISRVHNHGSDHLMPEDPDIGEPDPLYARFAYSTRTGNTALRNAADNDVQVSVRGIPSVRRRIHPLGTGSDWAASYHVPQFPVPTAISGGGPAGRGPVLPSSRIESLIIARGEWEVRVSRFIGVPDGTPAQLSGWALAVSTPMDVQVETTPTSIRIAGGGLVSELHAVSGWMHSSTSRAPQGTAFGRFAIVPELSAVVRRGYFIALVRLVSASSATAEATPNARPATAPITSGSSGGPRPAPEVVIDKGEIEVRWRDGVHRLSWGERPEVAWSDERLEIE